MVLPTKPVKATLLDVYKDVYKPAKAALLRGRGSECSGLGGHAHGFECQAAALHQAGEHGAAHVCEAVLVPAPVLTELLDRRDTGLTATGGACVTRPLHGCGCRCGCHRHQARQGLKSRNGLALLPEHLDL